MYQVAHKSLSADGSVNFEKAIAAGRRARTQAIKEGFVRLRVAARGILRSLRTRPAPHGTRRLIPDGYFRRVRGA